MTFNMKNKTMPKVTMNIITLNYNPFIYLPFCNINDICNLRWTPAWQSLEDLVSVRNIFIESVSFHSKVLVLKLDKYWTLRHWPIHRFREKDIKVCDPNSNFVEISSYWKFHWILDIWMMSSIELKFLVSCWGSSLNYFTWASITFTV